MKKYRGLSLERDYYYKFFLLKEIISGNICLLKGIIIEIFFTGNDLLLLEMDYIWKNFYVEMNYY